MMIRKHWKLSFILRALGDSDYCQWVRPLRSLPVEARIAAPAALADYIANQPELLDKPTLRLVVLGSALDASDDGAWWSTIGTLLGKSADWCQCLIVHHDDRGGLDLRVRPPSLVKTHVHVTQGGLSDVRCLPSKIDIALLPVSNPDVLTILLGNEENNLWPFLNADAAIITGLCHANEVALYCTLGEIFGLELKEHTNSFLADELPIQTLVIAKGKQQTDWERRARDADLLATASDVIAEVCVGNDLGGSRPDAFKVWGMEGLIKSSADGTDTFITLPRKYAVRRRTGVIYPIQDDLVIGDGFAGKLPPEAMADLPLDADWASRVAWAASAWRSGVGDMINTTLGGAMEAAGLEMPTKEGVLDLMARIGLEGEKIDALAEVLDGGGYYAPSRQERLVLDRLRDGDAAGLLNLLEANKALLTTMDETRLPLLSAVGRRGMHGVMQRMLELGTPVNIRDGGGRTALAELATTGRSIESVKMLLDAGADPDVADSKGWTALLLAVKTSRWENAHLLLDRGADPMIPNFLGLSAVGLAEGALPSEFEVKTSELLLLNCGFDLGKALKANNVIDNAQDIPPDLLSRLLSYI